MMSSNPIRPVARLIKRGLNWLAILGVLVLALSGLAAGLIAGRGPEGAVLAVHHGMANLRPFVLIGQIGVIGLVWWFWSPLIRRSRFTSEVENAWLAARHRLALWAIGLTALGGVLWFPR